MRIVRADGKPMAKTVETTTLPECQHLGEKTGKVYSGGCCGGSKTNIFEFVCAVHGVCVRGKTIAGVASCPPLGDCKDFVAKQAI